MFSAVAGLSASAIGLGVGTVAGLSVGPFLFNRIKPHDYSVLSEETDNNHKKPAPKHGLLVPSTMREALPLMEPWLTDPKYDRVAMINRLTATLWPTITKAILDMVLQGDVYSKVLYPQLKAQVFDKFVFVEDILLGQRSLRHGQLGTDPWLKGKDFTVGSSAPRVGGFKVVPTSDDEVLLETSMIWGSSAVFDVVAVLRFGALRLVVPIQLANISFKADVRVELRPLVDKIPCIGGVTVSLLRIPKVDCKLVLAKGVDIMALPFVPQLLNFGLRLVMEPMSLPFLGKPVVPGMGVVYPNTMSFPIMPNFGMMPAPKGAIKVTIVRLEGIKGGNDLYCKVEVRRGRYKQTKTIWNTTHPEFNEEFALIVDSFETDVLRIHVCNDEQLALSDTTLSTIEVPFAEYLGTRPDPNDPTKEVPEWQYADFIKTPTRPTAYKLVKVESKGLLGSGFKAASRVFTMGKSTTSKLGKLFSRNSKKNPSPTGGTSMSTSDSGKMAAPDAAPDVGTLIMKLEFIPFNEPKYDDEAREESEAAGKKDPRMSMFPAPLGRSIGAGTGILKGVLTVQLVRCIDLAPEGAKDMATYVKMLVSNDEKDEEQVSTTIVNETSPRWGDKYDFVLIPAATSELHLQVFNKSGLLGNLVGSIFKKKGEETDTSIGKLLIPVKEVAANGRLKDVWTLQDTDRGYIELSLTWQTCHVSAS